MLSSRSQLWKKSSISRAVIKTIKYMPGITAPLNCINYASTNYRSSSAMIKTLSNIINGIKTWNKYTHHSLRFSLSPTHIYTDTHSPRTDSASVWGWILLFELWPLWFTGLHSNSWPHMLQWQKNNTNGTESHRHGECQGTQQQKMPLVIG